MIKVLIADDDKEMRWLIKNTLSDIENVQVIGEVEDGVAMIDVFNKIGPDVIFIDVDMPKKNGIEAAREIYQLNPNVFFVFITAHSNYTHEAFEVYAVDYLLKPFSLERIKETISKILNLKVENKNTSCNDNNKLTKLFIQNNGVFRVINIKDINFITRIKRSTIVYTEQGEVKCYETLQSFEEKLNEFNFIKSHQGYIVNMDKITEIYPSGNKVYTIKFDNMEETALMTSEKFRLFRDIYKK